MIYNNLSLILRSVMIQAGFLGFLTGSLLSYYIGQASLANCIFRGTVLCVVFTMIVRQLMLSLFRAYLIQYELRENPFESPFAK
jgi:hypothetical protein